MYVCSEGILCMNVYIYAVMYIYAIECCIVLAYATITMLCCMCVCVSVRMCVLCFLSTDEYVPFSIVSRVTDLSLKKVNYIFVI